MQLWRRRLAPSFAASNMSSISGGKMLEIAVHRHDTDACRRGVAIPQGSGRRRRAAINRTGTTCWDPRWPRRSITHHATVAWSELSMRPARSHARNRHGGYAAIRRPAPGCSSHLIVTRDDERDGVAEDVVLCTAKPPAPGDVQRQRLLSCSFDQCGKAAQSSGMFSSSTDVLRM